MEAKKDPYTSQRSYKSLQRTDHMNFLRLVSGCTYGDMGPIGGRGGINVHRIDQNIS